MSEIREIQKRAGAGQIELGRRPEWSPQIGLLSRIKDWPISPGLKGGELWY